MKKGQIIVILLVAVLIGTLIGTFTTASRSVTFAEASAHPGKEVKISGTLVRESPVLYDPITDPTLTTFHLADKTGEIREVRLAESKPTGLENSESIDLYGTMIGDVFEAHKMLLKCPSKYNENNHLLAED